LTLGSSVFFTMPVVFYLAFDYFQNLHNLFNGIQNRVIKLFESSDPAHSCLSRIKLVQIVFNRIMASIPRPEKDSSATMIKYLSLLFQTPPNDYRATSVEQFY